MHKCVVMSDLHLVAPGTLSHGIDTPHRLALAVAYLQAHHADAAFCVMLGDLADTGDPAAYATLRDSIAALPFPVVHTLGNHDIRQTALDVLALSACPQTGRMDHALHLGAHLVLVLDSLQEGAPDGVLNPSQLDWVDRALITHDGGPAVVMLHHSFAPLGVPTDPIGLAAPDQLADLLKRHGGVELVLSGHVHTATMGMHLGLPFATIAGNAYNMVPRYSGTLDDVPRTEGPGQIGVLLAGASGLVLHFENFYEHNPVQSPDLHIWPPEAPAQ